VTHETDGGKKEMRMKKLPSKRKRNYRREYGIV